jgi:metal-dependent amidase/aminoacylase/carboxypeptidase family protein
MNIENMEAFVYVNHYGSFNKAAEALFLSQPSVTARIQTLERELECKLFDRQSKQTVLTKDGRKFLPYAEQAAQAAGLEVVRPISSSASEDFGLYQKSIPGVFIFVGTSGSQEWHHPAFDLDERALPGTARLLASLAESALVSIE